MAAAAIAGGVSLVTAIMGSNAAKDAAKKQAKAADSASAVTLEMFNKAGADLKPYKDFGIPALRSLSDMYGLTPGTEAFGEQQLADFRRAPDYQIAMREGIDNIDNSAAARGELKSGRTLKAVSDYASDLGTRKLDNYLGRLFQMAGMGENAAARTGSNAMAAGSSLSDLALRRGEAQASGIMGANDFLTSGIAGLGRNLAFDLERKDQSAYDTPSIY
jgi:hypothetical protein